MISNKFAIKSITKGQCLMKILKRLTKVADHFESWYKKSVIKYPLSLFNSFDIDYLKEPKNK